MGDMVPADTPLPSPLPAVTLSQAERALPRRTVLLVDDDADTRLIIRTTLERTRRFAIVGEAETGAEGIARAGETRPDLIVLDVQMPGMSGIEALPRILQASPASRVLIFSGHEPGRIASIALGLGASAFLEKTYDCSSLVPKLLAVAATTPFRGMDAPLAFDP